MIAISLTYNWPIVQCIQINVSLKLSSQHWQMGACMQFVAPTHSVDINIRCYEQFQDFGDRNPTLVSNTLVPWPRRLSDALFRLPPAATPLRMRPNIYILSPTPLILISSLYHSSPCRHSSRINRGWLFSSLPHRAFIAPTHIPRPPPSAKDLPYVFLSFWLDSPVLPVPINT